MTRVRLAMMLAVFAGCGGTGGSGEVFIALQSDFADFLTWQKTALGDEPLEGHPAGERFGYVKQPLAAGMPAYPVGAMIVKTVEVMPDEQSWDLFAMVKRGGNYNAAGARNWEFFTLSVSAGGVPLIASRGSNPSDAPGATGHGYSDPTGSGVTCNRCHGADGAEKTDFILSPLLAPQP
jgi:hypothetical protein